MLYLSQNLIALESNQPELYKQYLEYKAPEQSVIHVNRIQANDSAYIMQIKRESGEYFLNSKYSPINQAEAWAQQYNEIEDQSIVYIFGFGNGVIPNEVIKNGKNVFYIFFEPSIEIFHSAMEYYDLIEFFCNPKTYLVVKGFNDNYLESILSSSLTWHNLSLFRENCLPQYDKIFPSEYLDSLSYIKNMVVTVVANVATLSRFSNIRVINQIYNKDYILKSSTKKSCIDLLPKDMVGIVVSAGPSLRGNMKLLKQAKNKFFILAVDTALKFLLEEDIIPDAWISVDGLKPLSMFEDSRIADIPAFLDVESRYEVVDIAKKKKIFFDICQEYYAKIYKKYNCDLPSNLSGGSVATCAFGVLIYMGFTKIVLMGQDLALTDNHLYADGKVIDLDKVESKRLIEGYYGGTVYTRTDYYQYLQWFEQAVLYYKEVKVINATEGGANIKGAIKMTLKEVIEKYSIEEIDINAKLMSLPIGLSKDEQISIEKEIDLMEVHLQEIEKLAKEGKKECEHMLLLIENSTSKEKELKPVVLRLKQIEDKLGKYIEYNLIRQYSMDIETVTTSHLYDKKDDVEKERLSMIRKLQYLYEAAIISSKELVTINKKQKDEIII